MQLSKSAEGLCTCSNVCACAYTCATQICFHVNGTNSFDVDSTVSKLIVRIASILIVRTASKLMVCIASILIVRTATKLMAHTASILTECAIAAVCSIECCRAQRELGLKSELEKEKSKPGGGSKVRAAYLERMLQMMKDDLGKKEQQMDGKVADQDGCLILQNLLLEELASSGSSMLAAPVEKIDTVMQDDFYCLFGVCADLMTLKEQSVRFVCFSR